MDFNCSGALPDVLGHPKNLFFFSVDIFGRSTVAPGTFWDDPGPRRGRSGSSLDASGCPGTLPGAIFDRFSEPRRPSGNHFSSIFGTDSHTGFRSSSRRSSGVFSSLFSVFCSVLFSVLCSVLYSAVCSVFGVVCSLLSSVLLCSLSVPFSVLSSVLFCIVLFCIMFCALFCSVFCCVL